MVKNNRLEHLNIARGFAILLVLILHIFVPEIRSGNRVYFTIFMCISSLFMPLYTILSGYLFERGYEKYKQNGFKFFFKRKLQGLMIPYMTVSILSYAGIGIVFMIPGLASVLMRAGYARFKIGKAIFQILTLEGHIDKHLWFLYSLFIVFILTFIFASFFKSPIGLLTMIAIYCLPIFLSMPELAERICKMMLFFQIGRFTTFIDKYGQKKYFLPTAFIFGTLLTIQRFDLLNQIRLLDNIFNIFIGISGTLAMFCLSLIITENVAGRIISKVGDYSFIIYLLHQPFIVSGVSGILLMYTRLPHIIICIITFVLGISLPCLAEKFIIDRSRILRGLFLGDFKKREISHGKK